MDIGTPLREFGELDSKALRDAILAQDEIAWNEEQYWQDKYEVHRQTKSIVLVFTDGSNWPNSEVHKEPGWDCLADVAVPLMHQVSTRRMRFRVLASLGSACNLTLLLLATYHTDL